MAVGILHVADAVLVARLEKARLHKYRGAVAHFLVVSEFYSILDKHIGILPRGITLIVKIVIGKYVYRPYGLALEGIVRILIRLANQHSKLYCQILLKRIGKKTHIVNRKVEIALTLEIPCHTFPFRLQGVGIETMSDLSERINGILEEQFLNLLVSNVVFQRRYLVRRTRRDNIFYFCLFLLEKCSLTLTDDR